MKDTKKTNPAPEAVLLTPACDVTGFCSTDKTRYVITGVHYHAEKKLVEATDGGVLIRVPVSSVGTQNFPPPKVQRTEQAHDCIIPAKEYKVALASIPKKTKLPALRHAKLETTTPEHPEDPPATIYLTTTNLDNENTSTARGIEGRYPNVDQATPDFAPKFAICLSAQLLKEIADYAVKHGEEMLTRGKPDTAVKFLFGDELQPVRFEILLGEQSGGDPRSSNPPKEMGVLMPMRMI